MPRFLNDSYLGPLRDEWVQLLHSLHDISQKEACAKISQPEPSRLVAFFFL